MKFLANRRGILTSGLWMEVCEWTNCIMALKRKKRHQEILTIVLMVAQEAALVIPFQQAEAVLVHVMTPVRRRVG